MGIAALAPGTLRKSVAIALLVFLASPGVAQEVNPLLVTARDAHRQHLSQEPLLSVEAQGQANPQVRPASASDWNNLARLEVGARIRLEAKDGVTRSGKFAAFSDEAISLREGKREVSYRREEVVSVSWLGSRRRGRWARIGFLIGFGGGTAALAAWGASDPADEGAMNVALISLLLGLPFGGVGAAVGALAAPRTKTLIYRAAP